MKLVVQGVLAGSLTAEQARALADVGHVWCAALGLRSSSARRQGAVAGHRREGVDRTGPKAPPADASSWESTVSDSQAAA